MPRTSSPPNSMASSQLSNAQIPRAEATIQVEFSSIVLAPGGPSTLEPPARGERLGGVDRSGLEVLVHLLLGDQSVLELLPQPVAQVVVLGFGHLGLALVET